MQPKHYKHVTDCITKVKCNASTCLIRPQHAGPMPDRIRQVSLYSHYLFLILFKLKFTGHSHSLQCHIKAIIRSDMSQ